MKKICGIVLVLAFTLWHASTVKGCGGGSGSSGSSNAMHLFTNVHHINLDYPYDAPYAPLRLPMDGEVTSDLPGATGSPSSVDNIVPPQNSDLGAPNHWAQVDFYGKVAANWRFKVDYVGGACHSIWAPAKPMVGDAIYTFTCPVYYISNNPVGEDPPTVASIDESGALILDPNEIGEELSDNNTTYMYPGDGLVSSNGDYTLIYLSDGNLVEYDSSFMAVWMSWTSGSGGGSAHVHLQDGNLVIYNSSVTPVFTTNTGNNPGSVMALQNAGNIVIYDSQSNVLWASPIP